MSCITTTPCRYHEGPPTSRRSRISIRPRLQPGRRVGRLRRAFPADISGSAYSGERGRRGLAARLTNSASFVERVDHATPTIPFGLEAPADVVAHRLRFSFQRRPASAQSVRSEHLRGFEHHDACHAAGLLCALRRLGRLLPERDELRDQLQRNPERAPTSSLPSGNVLIASMLPDGTNGLGALNFGGNGRWRVTRRRGTPRSSTDTLDFLRRRLGIASDGVLPAVTVRRLQHVA